MLFSDLSRDCLMTKPCTRTTIKKWPSQELKIRAHPHCDRSFEAIIEGRKSRKRSKVRGTFCSGGWTAQTATNTARYSKRTPPKRVHYGPENLAKFLNQRPQIYLHAVWPRYSLALAAIGDGWVPLHLAESELLPPNRTDIDQHTRPLANGHHGAGLVPKRAIVFSHSWPAMAGISSQLAKKTVNWETTICRRLSPATCCYGLGGVRQETRGPVKSWRPLTSHISKIFATHFSASIQPCSKEALPRACKVQAPSCKSCMFQKVFLQVQCTSAQTRQDGWTVQLGVLLLSWLQPVSVCIAWQGFCQFWGRPHWTRQLSLYQANWDFTDVSLQYWTSIALECQPDSLHMHKFRVLITAFSKVWRRPLSRRGTNEKGWRHTRLLCR